MPLPLIPLAVAGGAAYFVTKKPSPGSVATAPAKNPNSAPSAAQPAQPSQKYPVTPINPPRVDNQNQPWYNGGALPSNPVGNVVQAAGIAGATSSIVHSLSDIWGNIMPNGESANTDAANLTSTDQVAGDANTSVAMDEATAAAISDSGDTSSDTYEESYEEE